MKEMFDVTERQAEVIGQLPSHLIVRGKCLEYHKARSIAFVDDSAEGCLAITLNRRAEVNSEDSQMTVQRDGKRW